MDFTKTELDSENTDLFTLVTQSLKEFVLSPRVSGGHEQITYLLTCLSQTHSQGVTYFSASPLLI